MKTPIYDFVSAYKAKDIIRMHMPGHKGKGNLCEDTDITEIAGADSLYEADGIIRESEKNAGEIFGADSFYSAEGSSLSIRAMLYLILQYARLMGKEPRVAYSRGAHKVFYSGCALLGIEPTCIECESESYLSGGLTAKELAAFLDKESEAPTALYVTSPDYIGNLCDFSAIGEICKKKGILLCVDNAHGAYLKFLEPSQHPIDLGADISCDSAHKTLPVLTGGAYLHISRSAPDFFRENAKDALAIFGSTSPSYHILASVDLANRYMKEEMKPALSRLISRIAEIKSKLINHGYRLAVGEPMKITLMPKSFGYTGYELAEIMRQNGVEIEFCDPDHLVMMPSTMTDEDQLCTTLKILTSVERRSAITTAPPPPSKAKRAMGLREATLMPGEFISTDRAEGRILQAITVGCPPAVPIIVSGEVIDKDAIAAFKYYGINTVKVVKEIKKQKRKKSGAFQP